MPFPVCLQDWITVQGYQQTYSVIQAEVDYVDISTFQELAVYAEISSNTNTILAIQTSPTRESAYFSGFNSSGGAPLQWTTAGGVQEIITMRFVDATTPTLAARLLRWTAKGNATGAWSITFRIWLSLNQAHGTL